MDDIQVAYQAAAVVIGKQAWNEHEGRVAGRIKNQAEQILGAMKATRALYPTEKQQDLDNDQKPIWTDPAIREAGVQVPPIEIDPEAIVTEGEPKDHLSWWDTQPRG